jgi:hypothetical protein
MGHSIIVGADLCHDLKRPNNSASPGIGPAESETGAHGVEDSRFTLNSLSPKRIMAASRKVLVLDALAYTVPDIIPSKAACW